MVLTVTEFLPEELVLFDNLNTLFTDLLIKITFSISVSSLNFNIWLDLNNGLKYEYLEWNSDLNCKVAVLLTKCMFWHLSRLG